MTAPQIELDGVIIEFIDHEQGRALLDQQARRYMNISGAEFARSYCAGELDPCESDVAALYFLLGLAGIECDAGPNPI